MRQPVERRSPLPSAAVDASPMDTWRPAGTTNYLQRMSQEGRAASLLAAPVDGKGARLRLRQRATSTGALLARCFLASPRVLRPRRRLSVGASGTTRATGIPVPLVPFVNRDLEPSNYWLPNEIRPSPLLELVAIRFRCEMGLRLAGSSDAAVRHVFVHGLDFARPDVRRRLRSTPCRRDSWRWPWRAARKAVVVDSLPTESVGPTIRRSVLGYFSKLVERFRRFSAQPLESPRVEVEQKTRGERHWIPRQPARRPHPECSA